MALLQHDTDEKESPDMNVVKKAICLATSVLMVFLLLSSSASPAFAETGKAEIHAGDVVCFGTCDDACGFDGKWVPKWQKKTDV